MNYLSNAVTGMLLLILGIRGLCIYDYGFIQILSSFVGIVGFIFFIVFTDLYIDEKIELLVKRIKSQ